VTTFSTSASGTTIFEPPAVGRAWAHGIAVGDRVSLRDGRVGRVIGFYSRDDETVLVCFGPGESVEYAPASLHLEAPLAI